VPSRERIFYECLEGECQEHASHTGENNNRVTRAMLSSSIRCNTYSGDNTADQKQFPDSQSMYSNMYSMILTAQGEATTPVAEGTSPEERSPSLGVEHESVAEENYIPPDTRCSPTEVVHTQREADCLSPLERIPKKGSQCETDCLSPLERIPSGGTEHGVGYKMKNKVISSMSSILKSQHPSGMPVTNMPQSCLKRMVSSICVWATQEKGPDQPDYREKSMSKSTRSMVCEDLETGL